jgi:hypothetical protein
MGINFIEILNAWITSYNPTETQKELAKKRLEICMEPCEFKKDVLNKKDYFSLCGGCGCPISKKIYTDRYGTCPLHKWEKVENEYKNSLMVKQKTII